MVGQRIAELRKQRDEMTQAQLGEKLRGVLGGTWPRQTVSLVEKGERSLNVPELLALAKVLEVTVGRLLFPSPGVEQVTMPKGDDLSRDEIERLLVDPEARNVLPTATARLRQLGVWLNAHIASATTELRELHDDYESIALGAKALPDDGLRAREAYNQALTDRGPRLRGEPEPEGDHA